MSGRLCSVLALGVALAGGCGRGETPAGRTRQAIAGGSEDTVRRHVVGISIAGEHGVGTCTGSLIAPNLVLTALHCVGPTNSDRVYCEPTTVEGTTHPATTIGPHHPPRAFTVTPEPVTEGSEWQPYAVDEVIVPPEMPDGRLCGRDIALLRLAEPMLEVTPVDLRLDVAPELGEQYTAVGYGSGGPDGGPSGVRRARGELTTIGIGPVRRAGLLSITAAEWLGDDGTCRGDSGGPALDELGAVYGVLSRAAADQCTRPVYTRVDAWAAWLRAEARRAIAHTDAPAPQWLDPPPERSAAFGDACRGTTQCLEPWTCEISGDRRRCTQLDCTECPAGWVCDTARARSVCVPDPDAPVDAGFDAPDPVPDAARVPVDAMTVAEEPRRGCAAAPATRCAPVSVLFAAVAASVAALGARRGRGRA